MDIIMPKMGESVSEGTIIKWHKKPGDSVKRDEIIFEISTDKVDTEIPSPEDGVLTEIKVNEGETVEVGTVVAIINGEGNKPAQTKAPSKAESKSEPEKSSSGKKDLDEEVAERKEETDSKPAPAAAEQTKKTSGSLIEIAMPKMGESVMEGTIIKWHKKVGESVKKDETIFEIGTDKVDTEVPSPAEGTIAEILVAEQETVEVGTIVAKIASGGYTQQTQAETEIKQEAKDEKPQSAAEHEKEVVSTSMHDSFSSAEASNLNEESKTEGSKFLSPLVLNIAQKENVSFDELNKIKGTGLDGRVTKKDVLGYIENRGKKPQPVKEVKKEEPAKTYAPTYQPSYTSADVEKIPMDNIRQKIMQHMVNSRDTSVHVNAMLEVDMGRIYNFIQSKRDELLKKENIKLTYMPFIANAVVKALKEFPLVNSAIDESTVVKKKFINLGIAVAVEPTGLIVPNIKNADEKNIIGMAKAINDIANRTRTKKITPDDISNGTFTITNYGVFGTLIGTPIINQPEVAILGVGSVVKRPVVIDADGTDTIAIKPVMALVLAHDHRLIDGMLGGRFLKFIKDTLEGFDPNNF